MEELLRSLVTEQGVANRTMLWRDRTEGRGSQTRLQTALRGVDLKFYRLWTGFREFIWMRVRNTDHEHSGKQNFIPGSIDVRALRRLGLYLRKHNLDRVDHWWMFSRMHPNVFTWSKFWTKTDWLQLPCDIRGDKFKYFPDEELGWLSDMFLELGSITYEGSKKPVLPDNYEQAGKGRPYTAYHKGGTKKAKKKTKDSASTEVE
ncbi:hypothetical protein PRZ48_008048 [Zasmidium cellare]|uniref:Uncharacterized protein n=1 Tax=Zasmidium cellare TaxID=395010 RepID=A0ABR0EEF9_ZASCE|nr:hypothetical protein PRZ48_008048 [Zasmidium cellare]